MPPSFPEPWNLWPLSAPQPPDFYLTLCHLSCSPPHKAVTGQDTAVSCTCLCFCFSTTWTVCPSPWTAWNRHRFRCPLALKVIGRRPASSWEQLSSYPSEGRRLGAIGFSMKLPHALLHPFPLRCHKLLSADSKTLAQDHWRQWEALTGICLHSLWTTVEKWGDYSGHACSCLILEPKQSGVWLRLERGKWEGVSIL